MKLLSVGIPCYNSAEYMAKAIETKRVGRTTYLQTLHTLEVMDSVLKSAQTGMPVNLSTTFERKAPMDASKEHGIL